MVSFAGALRRIKNVVRNPQVLTERLIRDFPVFAPGSANAHAYPQLTLSTTNTFPASAARLANVCGLPDKAIRQSVDAFAHGAQHTVLRDGLISAGSDKAAHGYHPMYGEIFTKFGDRPVRILEIGLGTNNANLVSTMGASGRPGASIRAFKKYLSTAELFGADIDRDILFSEERIRTAFVDQLQPSSFLAMAEDLGCPEFDLIIDDGLHAPTANLNTLAFAINAVAPGGWIVIEDIPPRALPVWDLVPRLVSSDQFETFMLEARDAYVFVAHKRANPVKEVIVGG